MSNPDNIIKVPENHIAIFRQFNTIQCNPASPLILLCIDALKCKYDTVKCAYQKLTPTIHPDKHLNNPDVSKRGNADTCPRFSSHWCETSVPHGEKVIFPVQQFFLSMTVKFSHAKTTDVEYLSSFEQ